MACRGPLDGVKIAISLFRYAALRRSAANARIARCKSNGLVIRCQDSPSPPNHRFFIFRATLAIPIEYRFNQIISSQCFNHYQIPRGDIFFSILLRKFELFIEMMGFNDCNFSHFPRDCNFVGIISFDRIFLVIPNRRNSRSISSSLLYRPMHCLVSCDRHSVITRAKGVEGEGLVEMICHRPCFDTHKFRRGIAAFPRWTTIYEIPK